MARQRKKQRPDQRPARKSTGSDGDRGPGERIQKILARAGLGSRRSCEELITHGRVAVNGRRVTELGTRADAERDRITLDGKPVRVERIVYYAVNKPRGYISTTDEDADTKVTDLVPPRPRVYPVGRLDVDSQGLMILTNDGELANRMTHPRYGLRRVYRAEVKGDVSDRALGKLSRGVHLAEGKTLPPEVRVLHRGPEGGTLEVAIREGMNREVRRMLAAVGLRVKRLARTALGPVSLGKLSSGSFRELRRDELARLRKAVAGPGQPPPGWLKRGTRARRGPPPSTTTKRIQPQRTQGSKRRKTTATKRLQPQRSQRSQRSQKK